MTFCRYGWLDVVKVLLDKKFKLDINYKDKFGNSAILVAAVSNNGDIVREIIIARGDEIDLNASDRTGSSILHYSCGYGDLETAIWLMQICPEINIRADNDYAFRWACEKDYFETAKWLTTICSNYVIIQESPEILFEIKN